MAYVRRSVVGISVAVALCSGAVAQDTYTQGASMERRTPAETKPLDGLRSTRNAADDTRRVVESSRGLPQARDIAAAVEKELYHDFVLTLDDVDVSVEGNTVTLSGTVASLMAKERAAEIAGTVKGVTAVINELVVRPYVQRNAEALDSAIRQALLVSPATEAFQIQAKAEPNGSVRLHGDVDSWTERELVERVAGGVAGVTSIHNQLEVRYAGPRTDIEIAAEVERMLQWDAYIDDSQIDVHVRNAVVTLSGTVGSAAEKKRATNIAWTAGTKDVDANGLRVSLDGTDGMSKQPAQLSKEKIGSAGRADAGDEVTFSAKLVDAQTDASFGRVGVPFIVE